MTENKQTKINILVQGAVTVESENGYMVKGKVGNEAICFYVDIDPP